MLFACHQTWDACANVEFVRGKFKDSLMLKKLSFLAALVYAFPARFQLVHARQSEINSDQGINNEYVIDPLR
jgi:hypothetical protein